MNWRQVNNMGITFELTSGLSPSYEIANYEQAFLLINEMLEEGNTIKKVVIA